MDSEILELLKKNPEKGMRRLSRDYGGLVYAIVRGRLGGVLGERDIEECVCDVLFEVYENREIIDSLKGFVALTAKRRAIDRCRGAFRRGTVEPLEDEFAEDGTDFVRGVEIEELREVLVREITALGQPDCEILIRKYFYSQRSREIAKALGMKENTVDQRVRRALQRLRGRKELLEFFGGE